MAYCLLDGGALQRPLASPLPIRYGVCRQPGFAVMVRDQFRSGLDRVGETAFEQFGDLAMVLLAGAPQQRLVRRILDQRVLEDVARPRRAAALVQEFGLDQPAEAGADLFITGSEINGQVWTEFDDAGHPIDIKDHRAVFLLKHRQDRRQPFHPGRDPEYHLSGVGQAVSSDFLLPGRLCAGVPAEFEGRQTHFR